MMNINSEDLQFICCPLGKAELKYQNNKLICSKCGVIFPFVDDIPLLIIESAELPQGIHTISDLKCQKENKLI